MAHPAPNRPQRKTASKPVRLTRSAGTGGLRKPGTNPGRHRRQLPRTLHMIDLENLCPAGRVTSDVVETIWTAYAKEIGVFAGDAVMVAVGVSNAATAFLALPMNIQRLIGRGCDGADLALLAAAEFEWAQRRFERVIVASGDHIFAPRIVQWSAAGLPVELVLGAGSMARVLKQARVPVHRLTVT